MTTKHKKDKHELPNTEIEKELVDELAKDLIGAKDETEKLEDLYKRALADYHNLLKRTEEERLRTIKFANEVVLLEMIEIFDELKLSTEHLNDEGLTKIFEKFKKKLTNSGIEFIDEKYEKFDPEIHDAIETTVGKKDTVIKVHRHGYKLNGKVIKPALVCVGNGE